MKQHTYFFALLFSLIAVGVVGTTVSHYHRPANSLIMVQDPELGTVFPYKMYIRFTATATPEQISSAVSAVRGFLIEYPGFFLLQLPTTTDITELKHALRTLPSYPGVESVSQDPESQLFSNGGR